MTLTQPNGPPDSSLPVPPLLLRPVGTDGAVADALKLLAGHGTASLVPFRETHEARLFTLSDLAGETDDPAAAARAAVVEPGTMALQALAVHPDLPAPPVACRLIVALADWLRAAGWRRVVVVDTGADAEWTAAFSAAGFNPSGEGGRRGGWLELVL